MNDLVVSSATLPIPAMVAAAGERAGVRFLEFFTAQIRNPHTRRAYARAAAEFLAWCEGIASHRDFPGAQPDCADSVTLVLDKGSAALANTLELEQAGVGWISALPWSQAPAEFRSSQQLTPLSSQQPGVSAAAETMVVHGKQYRCVVKYSAPFAGEQLHSLTTSLSKAMQSMRRLARELATSAASFTERGLRNRIARWLSPQFVGELISYTLEQRDGRWHLQFDFDHQALERLHGAKTGTNRPADQPLRLVCRAGDHRLFRSATHRAGFSWTQGWGLAGMGTDVSLDRPEDPRPCLLLHVGNLAVAVCTPPGCGSMARALYRRTNGTVTPDSEIHTALSASGPTTPAPAPPSSMIADATKRVSTTLSGCDLTWESTGYTGH